MELCLHLEDHWWDGWNRGQGPTLSRTISGGCPKSPWGGGVCNESDRDSSSDSWGTQPPSLGSCQAEVDVQNWVGGAKTTSRPHPGEARRVEVALVWLEPLGEIVRRGGGVMSSRLGAVPAVSFLV